MEVVNRYSEKDLQRVLLEYGEEPHFRKIAKRIVSARHESSIDTCAGLADIVLQAYGGRGKTHPATRTFQASRIEVNGELGELRKGLERPPGVLKSGGRLCVISYHSLEDRIVRICSGKWEKRDHEGADQETACPGKGGDTGNAAARSSEDQGGREDMRQTSNRTGHQTKALSFLMLVVMWSFAHLAEVECDIRSNTG